MLVLNISSLVLRFSTDVFAVVGTIVVDVVVVCSMEDTDESETEYQSNNHAQRVGES